jgi:hypothetical protein
MSERFLDTGDLIYELDDEFLVVCPKCSRKAKVLASEIASEKINNKLFGGFDWYFRLPLWLEISCCGETLWAYNLRHLEILEDYVSAKLRERTKKGRNSFLSKLPNWIKSAKNRREVLKAIGKLKEKSYGSS